MAHATVVANPKPLQDVAPKSTGDELGSHGRRYRFRSIPTIDDDPSPFDPANDHVMQRTGRI
jgi:hypothetical protein